MIIVCNVPVGTRREDFKPFPSSSEALTGGCTCPEQTLWPKQIRFSSDCPVHELERPAQ